MSIQWIALSNIIYEAKWSYRIWARSFSYNFSSFNNAIVIQMNFNLFSNELMFFSFWDITHDKRIVFALSIWLKLLFPLAAVSILILRWLPHFVKSHCSVSLLCKQLVYFMTGVHTNFFSSLNFFHHHSIDSIFCCVKVFPLNLLIKSSRLSFS